ncbi:MAG: CPBP family intramembrane metalloprotease [Erysipelotrichaceae bacterium]|nr:CPBP family intramembrane metalloprotease [Erysipelotrichaceae bacterium]
MGNITQWLKKIRSNEFRWYDHFLLTGFASLVLALSGQVLGLFIQGLLKWLTDGEAPLATTAIRYFGTIGTWIVMIAFLLIVRRRRPILKAISSETKGNTLKNFLIGLAIGFGMNFSCALVAMANRDIHIHFDSFDLFGLLLMFFCVFVQSSSEEVVDRAYYYQCLRKGYRSPFFAIIMNALIFSLMHFSNPGFTFMSFLNILASGIMASLAVYYFDSLWMAFGIHTAWNYTQNILLGLPNSGAVVPFSLFKLDTASATNSFAYNVDFGIEGTLLSTILLYVVCLAFFLIGRKYGPKSHNIWKEEIRPVETDKKEASSKSEA